LQVFCEYYGLILYQPQPPNISLSSTVMHRHASSSMAMIMAPAAILLRNARGYHARSLKTAREFQAAL